MKMKITKILFIAAGVLAVTEVAHAELRHQHLDNSVKHLLEARSILEAESVKSANKAQIGAQIKEIENTIHTLHALDEAHNKVKDEVGRAKVEKKYKEAAAANAPKSNVKLDLKHEHLANSNYHLLEAMTILEAEAKKPGANKAQIDEQLGDIKGAIHTLHVLDQAHRLVKAEVDKKPGKKAKAG